MGDKLIKRPTELAAFQRPRDSGLMADISVKQMPIPDLKSGKLSGVKALLGTDIDVNVAKLARNGNASVIDVRRVLRRKNIDFTE